MPVLQIQLLGDFRLTYNNTASLTSKIHARQQALLAYLMLHRDAPQSRHHLAFLFWPDTGEAQALTNLRNLLHKVREALPDSAHYLYIDSQTVQWIPDSPYFLDVAEFVTLAQSNVPTDLEKAVNLYHGDLLTSCYDEWILAEREHLYQLLFTVLERLVSHLEIVRNYSAAIGYAQQLVRYDPLREESYRQLMRLHALNEDRAAIMHVYHTCATNLQRELGVEPSTSTTKFYQQLLNVRPQPASVQIFPASVPFVGRKAEWALLQNLWADTAIKPPHLVLIKGEAGIGKTRLAEELAEWVRRQGQSVLIAHCYSTQGQLAYAPLVECLQPWLPQNLEDIWLTELSRLIPEILIKHPQVPEPATITQDWQRLRLFKALSHALPKDRSSLLIHLEDIQWCDRDTLDWLHYLLQTDVETSWEIRLLVVATLRMEETLPDHPLLAILADLRRSDQLTEIELGPLDEADTFLLASHVAGRPLDPNLKPLLFQGSEGQPLFVVEMIRSGLSQLESHNQDYANAMLEIVRILPHKVRQVIQERLNQLSPSAQELICLAAAIGRSFKFNVLMQAMQADEETLVHALDELWRRRIIREQGTDTYDFTHDKIREVVYTAMSLARRRLSHQRIAQAFENIYSSEIGHASGQIATHFELAGQLEQAIPYYEHAAAEAQRIYANTDAVRDYRRAIKLLEGPASYSRSMAARLYEQLGDVLHWTGKYEEARTTFQQATQAVPATEVIHLGRLYRKIGNTWREQRRYPEALQTYKEADQSLNRSPAEKLDDWWQEWIQISLETMLVYYWLGNLLEGDQLRLTLQPAVEDHATPSQRVMYLQARIRMEYRRNRYVMTDEIVTLSEETLQAQQDMGNLEAIPSTQFGLGFALLWHGEPHEAIRPFEIALQMAEDTGDVSLQARCLSYLAVAHRQCGQVEETQRYAAHSLEVATLAQMPEYMAIAKSNQAWVAWRADNLDLSQELSLQAVELWKKLPAGHASAPFQWLGRFPLIAVALLQGKLSLAIEEARIILNPSQQRLPEALEASLAQAIQAWETDQHTEARTILNEAITLAQQAHYL